MINRSILNNPDQPFDYFNDANDTINWLHRLNTLESIVAARQLMERWDNWRWKTCEILKGRQAEAQTKTAQEG